MDGERKTYVLVVDDFSETRQLIKDILTTRGYEHVLIAENGQEALSILQSSEVDLIISDMQMPVMNGLELLMELRKDDRLRAIPFIMTSGEALPQNLDHTMGDGEIDFLRKPFSVDMLMQKVQILMGSTGERASQDVKSRPLPAQPEPQ